jgi:flagellar hook-basal body complex protein FliE
MVSAPFTAAANAYSNAARLISQSAKPQADATASAGQGVDFAQMVANSIESVEAKGRTSDQMALDMVNGKANVVDMVTAISETEMAIETMVTVRDRVISAYEEIMRMPI